MKGSDWQTGPPSVHLVSYRSIAIAWKIIKSDWLRWFPAAMLTLAISVPLIVGVPLITNLIVFGTPARQPFVKVETIHLYTITSLLMAALGQAIYAVLQVGVMNMAFNRLAGQAYEVKDLLLGFRKFFAVFTCGLLLTLLINVGFLCFFLPGLYLIGATMLAPMIVAKQKLGPVSAIRKSIQTIHGLDAIWLFMMLLPPLILAAVSGRFGAVALGVESILTGVFYNIIVGVVYYTAFPPDGPEANIY